MSDALPVATQTSFNGAQVTAMKVVKRTRKGRPGYLCSYSGTFVTRDDALLVVPPTPRRREKPNAGPDTEQKMLKVLFSTNLSPRADPAVADNCETQDGLRAEFSKMCKAARTHERRSSRGTNTISSPAVDRRFDCLLLVGATREGESHREGMIPKVGTRANVDFASKDDNAGRLDRRALACCFR